MGGFNNEEKEISDDWKRHGWNSNIRRIIEN
jgi:hypothetical protein